MSQGSGTRRPGAWPGYVAAAWAFAFAIPSFLWGAGLSAGSRSVGRDMPSYRWSNHPGALGFVLFTGCLKVLGGLFALALVRPGWPLPGRRVTVVGGYVLAAFLFVYGLQDVVGPLLLEIHAARSAHPDWYATRWHMVLWGPYFALWGVWLAFAVRYYQFTHPRPGIA